MVYLPFPKDSGSIPHPLTDEHPFFSFPLEAFDELGENLICIKEKRWMGNEKIGTRPLPALVFAQELLRPEVFAHIELADTKPETLCRLMDSSGLIIAPVYESQKRFIDCRFHDRTSGGIAYEELHPLEVDGVSNMHSEDYLDLAQAAQDTGDQYLRALGGSTDYEQPFDRLCGGGLMEAAALSEYARRITCRKSEGQTSGGILSYYEVLLTVRGLFGAMADLIDLSVADGSMERFEELIVARSSGNHERPLSKFALEQLAVDKSNTVKRLNELANVGSYTAREAFDFLQCCVIQTRGVTWGQVVHQSIPAYELHKGITRKLPEFLKPQRSFYEKQEPRYLADRYCEGSFSAALAAQFLSTLADPAPWKQCDNPECQAYFKHHFSKGAKGNPKATSCSPECSTRKRNRLYNKEAQAIRTACKRYSSTEEAVAYVEQVLSSEISLKDLPKARSRWEEKCSKRFREI